MSQTDNPAAQYVARRIKNLKFFQATYPGVFDYFSSYELKASQLDILPDTNDVDLIEGGSHIYGGGAKAYVPKELAQFLSVFDSGTKVRSIKPLYEGEYKNPRYFAQQVDALYKKSPLKEEDGFSGYFVPDFFPMVVFMGCGLGLHIERLCNSRDIHHVCVVETDMDRFMGSLYTVDWQEIVSPYLSNTDKSFKFILIPNEKNEAMIRTEVWNYLIENCPIFPVMTQFYNHLGSPVFDRIIDAVNSDLYVHLFSFGNYDDELNQLNNAIHNFKQGAKRLPLPSKEGFDFPVCIVGSGPSLDNRIDWLKTFKDQVLIISCGTALSALHRHGIKPDIQIELESDYNTYSTQSLMEDKDYMCSVKLIGAAQLTPKMLTLFDEKRLFFKGEGALQGFFAASGEAIKEAAPTCTNAALAFAFHYSFSQIFLFGLDYGFPSKDQHHAEGAVYYKKDGSEALKACTTYDDAQLMRVDAADGNTILTTRFLFTSKRRTENMIWAAQHPFIYNCSNGSNIENTIWLDGDQFSQKLLSNTGVTKSSVFDYLFNDSAVGVDDEMISKQCTAMAVALGDLVDEILSLLSSPVTTCGGLTGICYRINNYLQQDLKANNESFYFFIRGSIWHFLHAGFSHTLTINDSNERMQFLASWQEAFKDFLGGVQGHFQEVIFKEFDMEKDLFVHRSIANVEKDPEMPVFEDMEWTFTGLMVDTEGRYSNYVV